MNNQEGVLEVESGETDDSPLALHLNEDEVEPTITSLVHLTVVDPLT